MAFSMPLVISAILLPSAAVGDATCGKTCEDDTQCGVPGSTCTWCLRDTQGEKKCTTEPTTCGGGPPVAARTDLPQYFVIGDSVSHQYSGIGHLVDTLEQKGYEAVPMNGGGGGEAGDTVRGLQCLPWWLGHNASRFKLVTWNFGLHDMEREGGPQNPCKNSLAKYQENLLNISALLTRRLPLAKQLYITTTPVPNVNLSPARKESDILSYNKVAKQVMAKLGVPVLDIWAYVDAICGGDPYTECPAGCAEKPGGEIKNCFQKKNNVHFFTKGATQLADTIAEAVDVLHSGKPCTGSLKKISIGLCDSERSFVV